MKSKVTRMVVALGQQRIHRHDGCARKQNRHRYLLAKHDAEILDREVQGCTQNRNIIDAMLQ